MLTFRFQEYEKMTEKFKSRDVKKQLADVKREFQKLEPPASLKKMKNWTLAYKLVILYLTVSLLQTTQILQTLSFWQKKLLRCEQLKAFRFISLQNISFGGQRNKDLCVTLLIDSGFDEVLKDLGDKVDDFKDADNAHPSAQSNKSSSIAKKRCKC